MISGFSILGVRQNKNPEIKENLCFLVFFLKFYQIHFRVCFSLFLLAEFVIPLFNCYFRDLRGFRDFRVFDLAFTLAFTLQV